MLKMFVKRKVTPNVVTPLYKLIYRVNVYLKGVQRDNNKID